MKFTALVGQTEIEVAVERENGFYKVVVDGVPRIVDAHKLEGDFYSIVSGDRSYEVSVEASRDGYSVRHGAAEIQVGITDPGRRAREGFGAGVGPAEITTSMPGRVVRVLVAEGDEVEAGQGVIVVEAMKMENEIAAPKAGAIKTLAVAAGDTVESGALLLVVE